MDINVVSYQKILVQQDKIGFSISETLCLQLLFVPVTRICSLYPKNLSLFLRKTPIHVHGL